MKYKVVYSSLVLLLSISLALDLGLFHFAFATQAEKPAKTKVSKAEAAYPLVFARFPKSDSILEPQAAEEAALCKPSEAFQSSELPSALITNTDLCGPKPHLSGGKHDEVNAIPKWELPKAPQLLIWQHELAPGNRLVVELIGSDGLPIPAKYEVSARDTKQSVQVMSRELHSKDAAFLVAKVFGPSDLQVESWVMAITIK